MIESKLNHCVGRHSGNLRARLPHRAGSRGGFSLTELLVVIGIIILLIGLLLVALKQVRAKALRTRTETLLTQFASACTAFQSEHGSYPGVIPDEVILANPDGNGYAKLSFTENALLHMMGGYRVMSPNDYGTAVETEYNAYVAQAAGDLIQLTFGTGNAWKIAINKRKIGEGPVINGKPYAPYFTPGPQDTGNASYPIDAGSEDPNPVPTGVDGNQDFALPDLLDGWDNPVIYIRQLRSRGPLLHNNPPAGTAQPQFFVFNGGPASGVWRYLGSESLGDSGQDQELSIFGSATALPADKKDQAFAVLIGHPAFYKSPPAGDPLLGSPRGAFFLWSAGPDGIFMSRTDGTGSATTPIDAGNIDNLLIGPGPRVLDEFDDVRVYGGG